jgi:hypothetical protein
LNHFIIFTLSPSISMSVNQYNTPCRLITFIDQVRTEHQVFSDLQQAYLFTKSLLNMTDRIWHLKSWETTIALLHEYHTEDGSGLDVARSVYGDSISIFYESESESEPRHDQSTSDAHVQAPVAQTH